MSSKTIFIDESGAHGFTDLDDSNSFYIISAVEILTDELEDFKAEFNEALKKHKFNEFLKSTTLRKQYHKGGSDKIESFFNDIVKLPFTTYTIALDKRNIKETSGMKYKEVLYKYPHKILYDRIIRFSDEIEFISDDYGSNEFKHSFKKYIFKSSNITQTKLFSNIKINFVNKDKYVQIADWVAGIIRSDLMKEEFGELYDIVASREVFLLNFPQKRRISSPKNIISVEQRDDFAIQFAHEHVDQIKDKTTKSIMMFLMLNYWANPKQYHFAAAIINFLKESGGKEISEYTLRNTHIPNLRDQGFIIASSSEGYKIPDSLEDLKKYAHKISNNFCPAVKRLNKSIEAYCTYSHTPRKDAYSNMKEDILWEINEIIEEYDARYLEED